MLTIPLLIGRLCMLTLSRDDGSLPIEPDTISTITMSLPIDSYRNPM